MTSETHQGKVISALLADVTRLMRRRFEDEAKAFGVTLPQWKALGAIQKQDGITQVALSSCLDIDAMTLSGILDRLEKRGLVERFVHPDDSRAKLTRLTPSGSELVETARHVGTRLFNEAMAGLSEAEMSALSDHLTLIRNNLNDLDQAIAQTGKAS